MTYFDYLNRINSIIKISLFNTFTEKKIKTVCEKSDDETDKKPHKSKRLNIKNAYVDDN